MAEAARRFRRVLLHGSAMTREIASKEVEQSLHAMAPFDLMNTLRICPDRELAQKIVFEAERRNFKKFNGTDLTILLVSVKKGNLISSVFPNLNFQIMKTSDICTCLYIAGPTAASIVEKGVLELLNSVRLKQMSEINTTQVLHAISDHSHTEWAKQFLLTLRPYIKQTYSVESQKFIRHIYRKSHVEFS